MAINQNHLFEELNGVKCAIVEKNASAARVDFLRPLLEYNRYTVVVTASPPPKAAPAAPAPKPAAAPPAASPEAGTPSAAAPPPKPAAAAPAAANPEAATPAAPPETPPQPAPPPAPETFTIGVTDVSFNPTNAIFGRLLRTPDGHIVTLAYWQQKSAASQDDIPYFA